MQYKLLGKTGMRVSSLCLGTMGFGTEWGWGADLAESRRILEAYAAAGGNFVDTANYYTSGSSERILGELVKPDRARWVIATKYSLGTTKGDPNSGGNHRKNLTQAVHASLQRLGTDYIDLLWLHAWDFTTAIEEVMRGLNDLCASGKVLHIGISDTPAWIVARANTLAELRGWHPFGALQIEYSLIQRTPERDLLPMAQALGLSVTPWAPLASGLLTGKYKRGHQTTEGMRLKGESLRLSEKNFMIADTVAEVAAALSVTPAEVAIAWTMHPNTNNGGSNIIPIVGVSKASQVAGNLKAADLKLPSELLKQLDDVSKPELGFPHDFLASDNVRDILYAGTYSKIEKALHPFN